MFWGKKTSNTDKSAEKGSKKQNTKKSPEKKNSVGTSKSQRLREEALANARKARETLGEETIQRIAAALQQKQQSPIERAKAQIASADTDKVIDEILLMLDDKD